MLQKFKITSYAFILFLFGFTLITVAPVNAQTVDQLIERIQKLDAPDRARVLEYKYIYKDLQKYRPSDATPAAVADGPWNPSMGMCHNSRPCIKLNNCGKMCDASVRASKGWVKPNATNNPDTADTAGGAVTEAAAAHCQCGWPWINRDGKRRGKCDKDKVCERYRDQPHNPTQAKVIASDEKARSKGKPYTRRAWGLEKCSYPEWAEFGGSHQLRNWCGIGTGDPLKKVRITGVRMSGNPPCVKVDGCKATQGCTEEGGCTAWGAPHQPVFPVGYCRDGVQTCE